MAKKSPTEKAAEKRGDPTVRAMRGVSAYPEGTHPPVAPSDATWGPDRFSYTDLGPDEKPDETTVAQELTGDSMQEDVDKALEADAEAAAEAQEASDE